MVQSIRECIYMGGVEGVAMLWRDVKVFDDRRK